MDIFNILKILGLFNSGFKSPHPKFWKALKFSFMGFPGGSDGKESACSPGDLSLISGLGRSPGKPTPVATHSSILAWRIPWTEEPGRLQSMGSQELDMTL